MRKRSERTTGVSFDRKAIAAEHDEYDKQNKNYKHTCSHAFTYHGQLDSYIGHGR
jgi:hypothetical protein